MASGSPSQSPMASTLSSRASTPAPGTVEKPPDDSSKLKTFLSILKKFIGVSDIAAVRFSLPAQLLEPTPNLEYWNYLDRPETFISIGDSDEPLGRMLETLRFWFTKDLKYVKGKPCKPYNSTLGEFFRCNWEVEDTHTPPPSRPGSKPASKAATPTPSIKDGAGKKVKVSYLTEQTSHHPPVSAFYIECPEKGISAKGFDQLSAKFTGTSIRVTPGAHNLGIFITLHKRDDEQYHLTHVAANLGGILRGSLRVSVADTAYISCPKTKIKAILQYMEEGWLGKAQNRVEGVIFTYDPDNDKKETQIRDVPEKQVLARIEGNWHEKIYYTLGGQPFAKNPDKILLIDITPLQVAPKQVPPEELQLQNESLKFWNDVTNAIVNRQYSLATQLKQEIEERQRQAATRRKESGIEWQPRFFTGAVTPVGKPELTEEGRRALEGLQRGEFELQESKEAGAY